LNIISVEHISINTNDIQKSLAFYQGILGFKPLEAVDCGDFVIQYLALPDGRRLELFDYHGNAPKISHGESDTGLRHLAFEVKDVAALEKELRAAGVEITLPTCDLPNLGVRVVLFLDPNGVTLEFCEKL